MDSERKTEANRPQDQILSILRISTGVGMVATFIGLESDLRHLPEEYHSIIYVMRIFFPVYMSLALIVSYLRPDFIYRWHRPLLMWGLMSFVVYLTWLDVHSGDYQRSAYMRSIILVCLIPIFFRTIPLWFQGLYLSFAFLFYTVWIGIAYDLNPLFDDSPRSGAFLDMCVDLLYILAVLFLATRVLAKFRREEEYLQESLKRANRVKSDIIAKVNHELLTPLLGVRFNLASMKEAVEKGDAVKLRGLLTRSDRYCLYQKSLINNMLLATADEHREPFRLDAGESTDVRDAFVKAMRLVKDVHDGDIKFVLPPRLDSPCQEEFLMIMFINVLANSIEHSGSVDCLWEESQEYLLLTCTNEVRGPLPDPLERIFEEGSSTRSDSTRPILGLGMSITRSLARKMGGDIWAGLDKNRLLVHLRIPVQKLLAPVSVPG